MTPLQVILAAVFAGAALGSPAPPAPSDNAREIVRAAWEHWRGTTSEGEITMTIHRPGWERSMSMKAWTRGQKCSLVRVTAPRKDAGNATLMIDDSMWTCSPKVNRVLKVPSSMMSVLERTREFGVVMSLGVSPGKLGRLILLETALMGLIGLVVGAAIGAALVLWFGVYGLSFPGLEEMAGQFNLPDRIYLQVSVTGLLLGPVIVLLASLLASLYPAARLHWVEPVEAMRAA